jgi:anti-sigma factor RsiW
MSECTTVSDRLTAYVDQLLAPGDRLTVERHLATCDSCRHAAALEEAGRTLLRSRSARLLAETTLPPGFRTRCEALVSEAARTPRWVPLFLGADARRAKAAGGPARSSAPGRARLVPIAMAVVLTIFTASALVSLVAHRSDGLLAAELSSDHARCFTRFAGSLTADAGEMERMFADRYGWTVHVPRSSRADGVQLIGAKRCYHGDGPIPHILYRVNGQELSFYVLEGETRPPADLVAMGNRARVWAGEDKSYVLVSPAAAGDMTVAARYVMQEAR